MANRPIFMPKTSGNIGVEERMLEFKWHSGMAKVQKQKSIKELHETAKQQGFYPILEISSKSEEDVGIRLSAFNLCITTKLKNITFTVECAFQGSKVFENGGPYKDLIGMDSKAAKKDIRLKESGNLIAFEFFGKRFPIIPRTFFYDWIYINALCQNPKLSETIKEYKGFSDIEFNPKHSINCQARSAALFLSLSINECLADALSSPERFLELTKKQYEMQDKNIGIQNRLTD